MLIAEKCANRSSPPPSGVMKPKPFASLNHLTVPVAIMLLPYSVNGMWVVWTARTTCGAREHKRHRRTGTDKAWKPNTVFVRVPPGGRQAGTAPFPLPLKNLLQSSNIRLSDPRLSPVEHGQPAAGRQSSRNREDQPQATPPVQSASA